MSELMETVAIMMFAEEDPAACPFQGKPGPKNKPDPDEAEEDEGTGGSANNDEDSPNENYTVNLSGELAKSLMDYASATTPPESQFPPTDRNLMLMAKDGPDLDLNCGVKANAHHLIPGHASLPKSEVIRYMGDKDNQPKKGKKASEIEDGGGGIDYNVNDGKSNGIWLPSNNTLRGYWSGKGYQCEYAFLAINRAGVQFHDAHPDYSDFCIDILDAVAAKIETHVEKCPECRKKKSGDKFKYPPYPYLKHKIEAVAGRLSTYLALGNLPNWTPKVVTSRFNIFYKRIKESTISWKVKTASAPSTISIGDKSANVDRYAVRVVETGASKTAGRKGFA